MKPFREVDLSRSKAKGKLFLHPVPGGFEPIGEFVVAMGAQNVYRILCLLSEAEIGQRSPGYAEALTHEKFSKKVIREPVADFGVPRDRAKFQETIDGLAAAIEEGRNILIHCGAGFGRTGMAAICLLVARGYGLREATRKVEAAGSEPETEDQQRFVAQFAAAAQSD